MSNDHNQPSSGESGGGDSDTESRGGKGSSNKKRGLFPKQATNILRAWLFQNLSVSVHTHQKSTKSENRSKFQNRPEFQKRAENPLISR